ncbi:MAG: dihydrolipoyl dehydrogenase [Nitrospirota bacterium]|nr:MAG: dihydrolipoyl dehydrogenase [Nitrospirota bacterium]
MKEYDVIVIGSGAGSIIAENAIRHDMSVALIDKGPLGGTCLNVGCIPSKMLIYPADRIAEILDSEKLGIKASIDSIDFMSIMERMRTKVSTSAGHIRKGISNVKGLDLYEAVGRFTGEHSLDVDGEKITGDKIFIAAGARPHIPEGIGFENIDYLTNENALELSELPKSMIVIGGGFISAEYAHFFSAMGTDITIVQRNKMFLPDEEPELSDILLKEMRKRMTIFTGTEVVRVERTSDGIRVTGKDRGTSETNYYTAEKVLVVTGRKSNADLLQVAKAGIKTDKRNYIIVDDYLQTNKKRIWAFGDIIGKQMFRHVANREATVAWHNAIDTAGHKHKMDYHASPHAVFTYPEIASVGMKEYEAIAEYGPEGILVGKGYFSEVAMGEAMVDDASMAKAVVSRSDGKIVGFHVLGPHASILIQEVINAMALGGDIRILGEGMHIHPALSEVIISALNNLEEPSV